MSRPPLTLVCLLLSLVGCEKGIGDECATDIECGRGRSCDRASRGGYCTVTPCARDSCPEGSVCVEFETRETYCMATCDDGGDCRDGYLCDREAGYVPFCRQRP